ncbi:hypothetical protein AB4120_07350 [Cupriavidus sp. 2KB_3]|uniref:hypothetical protein n=1 Tax=Cupriavidus TaxID=106589 RepID=UPI0011EC4637|nr:hypothetical protein [Cupriavidus campinensis]
MGQREIRACWFGAGVLVGAMAASLCAMRAMARARVDVPADLSPEVSPEVSPAASPVEVAARAPSAAPESGADMFEYRGFVVHLFWQALAPARYKAWCDIWEAGAVVQEAGGPPATYPTAAEARMAAGAWARHWIQNNG